MTKWKWLKDESLNWLPHAVPVDLSNDLETDLNERGETKNFEFSSIWVSQPIEKFAIDLPGMIMIDRHMRSLTIEGLEISIPSEDWANFLNMLHLLPERKFQSGEAYYKLHGYLRCLVLSPEHRQQMIAAMVGQLEDAEKEAEEDLQRFTAKLEEVNQQGPFKVLSAKVMAAAVKGHQVLTSTPRYPLSPYQ